MDRPPLRKGPWFISAPEPACAASSGSITIYARGDGKADLWRKRHLIRYLAYLLLLPAIVMAGAAIHPLLWLALPLAGLVYLRQPYRRLPTLLRRADGGSTGRWLYCLVAIPWLRMVGDIAKMLGYPAGWLWRLRQGPPDWRDD